MAAMLAADALRRMHGNAGGRLELSAGGKFGKKIDRSGLHPLTCLTTLSRSYKQLLLESGVVLSRDLEKNRGALRAAGLTDGKIALVLDEARSLADFSKAGASFQ